MQAFSLDAASARFTCLLANASLPQPFPCAADRDCLASGTFARCFSPDKYAWVETAVCCCNLNYGLGGLDCRNIGPFGQLLLAFASVTALVLIRPICLNAINLWRTLHLKFNESRLFKASLFLCLVGCTSECALMLIFIARIAQRDSPIAGIDTALSWLQFASIAFQFLSMLNVSIVFLDLADEATRKTNIGKSLFLFRVALFRAVLLFVDFAFTVIASVVLAQGSQTSAVMCAICLGACIVFLYLRGAFRVSMIIHQISLYSGTLPSRTAREERILKSLITIRRTACSVGLATLACLVGGFLPFALIGGSNGGDTPAGSYGLVTAAIAWFFLAVSSFILTEYLARVSKLRLAKTLPISSNIPVESNPQLDAAVLAAAAPTQAASIE